jgi:hypothetical protein
VGGELKTYKNGLSDVFNAKFDYRIFKVGDTPGSFSDFDLGYNSELGGGDQKWDNTKGVWFELRQHLISGRLK